MSEAFVEAAAESLAAGTISRRRRVVDELRRNKGASIGLVVFGLVVVAALVTPLLPLSPTTFSLADRLAPPVWAGGTWSHPLGTDQLGRDELARLLYSGRVSLAVAALVVLIAGIFGTVLGMLAGYVRGWRESVLMRFVEVAIAFPGLLLAIAVVTMVGAGEWTLVIVLSAVTWMVYTWVTHDMVLSLKESAFVKAAETIGSRPRRIIRRHLLPNLVSPLLTIATIEFAAVLLAESSLSYLGFGIQPPSSSWGLMVAEGQEHLSDDAWLVIIPGFTIALVVLSLNLLASGLRIVSDPRQRDRQAFVAARRGLDGATGAAEPSTTVAVGEDADPLLTVSSLAVDFHLASGTVVHAVREVSLELRRGETLGIVGESGSGKSVTMRAVAGLLTPPGRVTAGDVRWSFPSAGRRIVGDRVTMVFQDASASLNPLVPIGRQLTEVLRRHKGLGRRAAQARALELLELVGIPSPQRRMAQFPYEFSGGMAQRVAIAIALAPEPDLIIADEPTTALDVTIQAQILELIRSVQAEFGMSVILIAHDLGLVAGICDRVAVLYAGRVVEQGDVDEIFRRPAHPYTASLIASTPRLDRARQGRLVSIPGGLPAADAEIPACAFAPRCGRAQPRCRAERPPLGAAAHSFACWYPLTAADHEPEAVRR